MRDQKAIESAIDEFIKAYNAADIIGVLAYYGDDLVKVRNGAPAENKSEAGRIAEVFSRFLSRLRLSPMKSYLPGKLIGS